MKKLNQLLDQLEVNIPHCETLNKEVSLAKVSWHIEHCLLVLNSVTAATKASDPNDYKKTFKLIKTVVFTLGSLPRGRGKSPKAVSPLEGITKDSLAKHLATTRTTIKALPLIPQDQFFKHPIFGNLKLKQTIKFLEIHTKHHVQIINDIIK